MKFRKIFYMVLCMIFCVLFSSCGTPQVKGDSLINKAQEDYEALDSAKVVITDIDTGEVQQEFTFMYDEKDTLMYSYHSEEDAEYNNGVESFTRENGKEKHLVKGDGKFQQYTRSSKFPMAGKALIFFNPDAVTAADMNEENGITRIRHVYDVTKIGAEGESGNVTGFSVEYFFDKNQNLIYFNEIMLEEIDGKEVRHAEKVEITQRNSVERISADDFKEK